MNESHLLFVCRNGNQGTLFELLIIDEIINSPQKRRRGKNVVLKHTGREETLFPGEDATLRATSESLIGVKRLPHGAGNGVCVRARQSRKRT